MRQLALLLASLSLAACETGSTAHPESTRSNSWLLKLTVAPSQDEPHLFESSQEPRLLEELELVLKRNDIEPADRAALTEIKALLKEVS